MNPTAQIPTLQSDALVREIEQQLKHDCDAVIGAAEREARAAIAQARAKARARMHDAVRDLRRDGALRLARAKAQLETASRMLAQRRAAQAVGDALPLLTDAIAECWRVQQARRLWTESVARLCAARLRPGSWVVEHPADWTAPEQRGFVEAVGPSDVKVTFRVSSEFWAGLRISTDQAVLDATPHGLLADESAIAALLLEEIVHEDN